MDSNHKKNIPTHIQIEPGEEIILTQRQHWSVFRNQTLMIFFIPFVSLSGVYLSKTTGFLNYNFIIDGLLGLGLISFLFGLVAFLGKYYLWSRTVYIVTNQRIIVVMQEGPFSRSIQQAPNHKIMNVSAAVEGLSANLYGYGDVFIEVLLPGKEKALVFQRVGKPHRVQHEIMKLSLVGKSSKEVKKEVEDQAVFEI